MFARWKAGFLLVGALAGLLLTGCGTNPYGDPYGYGAGYGTGYGDPYGSAYGSSYDSYGSAYGTSYDSSYGSSYDTSYDSSYGSSYDTSYDSSYGTDYGSSYGSGYPTTPTGSPTPQPTTAPLPPTDELPALSAWVEDVKETGVMGMGKIVAKVAVENPSGRTLSGRLEVRFTDAGNPTANKQTERVTLKPKEKQILTFTADAWRLDDAEAIITTDQDTSVTDGTTVEDGDSVIVDQAQ